MIRSRVAAEQRVDVFTAGLRARLLIDQLPAARPERLAIDKEQVLDPKHELHVGPAVDPRPTFRLGDPEIRELRLPGPQYIRLDLSDLADLRLAE